MLALLGNAVAGMFCSSPVQRDGAGYPTELLGAIVICSEHGEQTLSDDGGTPPAPAKPCQICIAVTSLLVTLALGVLLALMPLAPGARMAPDLLRTFAHRPCRAGLGSRAPPLPA